MYEKIGSTVGLSIDTIYQNAIKHGFAMDIETFYRIYDEQAKIIYRDAPPTKDIQKLINYLKQNEFKLGLVSSSRKAWIDLALTKLDIKDTFDFVLSLNDTKSIQPKPYPDGYLAAMNALGVASEQTIVLEDSNFGIASAKASGAYTIAYTEHLLPDYVQQGADAYASNIYDIIELINTRL